MLYIKNLLVDIWKYKIWILFFIVLSAGIGAFIGYKSKIEIKELTAQEQEEINSYNARIAEYEETVRTAQEALDEQTKAVENLQNYADKSILMRIDPEAVQVATAQYAINYGENVDAGRVNQGILTYISSGGLREDIENAEELEAEYWGDVLGYSISSNVLNLTLNHYNAEKANAIMDVICSRLEAQVPAIGAIQGSFTLTPIDRSTLEQADSKIMNTQSDNLKTLRNQTQWKADAENYLITCNKNLDSYKKNNLPEALTRQSISVEEGKVLVKKYGVLGAAFGFVISIAFLLFGYVVDDRIRNAGDLKGTVYNVLGTVKLSVFHPEAKRILMDVQALVENAGKEGVFLFDAPADGTSEKAVAGLSEELTQTDLRVCSGKFVFESAEELIQMISAGTCLIVAEAGKTSLKKLEECRKLCERYQISLIGVIVIE